jgi:hypothetical protein
MKDKTVGFMLFEAYLQRKNIGSSRIRGHWIIDEMPEAEAFIQGKNYETIIFQKVYWKEMARAFQGKKILDICDPDWLDGFEITTFLEDMDAITVPTKALKDAMEKFTKLPIFVIPDRVNFEEMLPPKIHLGRAKKVVWFGYSHNSDVLDPTLQTLKKMGLSLKVISDGAYNTSECKVEFVKWNPLTWQQDIQEADICLLPEKLQGRALFKSPNKMHQAWALGMPVAKTLQDLERFMDGAERQKEADEKYQWARENADVKKSVEEMRAVIESIKK